LASPTKCGTPVRFQSKKLMTTTPAIGARRKTRKPARLGASRTYASTIVRIRLRLRRRAPPSAGEGAAWGAPRSAAGLDTAAGESAITFMLRKSGSIACLEREGGDSDKPKQVEVAQGAAAG